MTVCPAQIWNESFRWSGCVSFSSNVAFHLAYSLLALFSSSVGVCPMTDILCILFVSSCPSTIPSIKNSHSLASQVPGLTEFFVCSFFSALFCPVLNILFLSVLPFPFYLILYVLCVLFFSIISTQFPV
jgi:hypothetical protein